MRSRLKLYFTLLGGAGCCEYNCLDKVKF